MMKGLAALIRLLCMIAVTATIAITAVVAVNAKVASRLDLGWISVQEQRELEYEREISLDLDDRIEYRVMEYLLDAPEAAKNEGSWWSWIWPTKSQDSAAFWKLAEITRIDSTREYQRKIQTLKSRKKEKKRQFDLKAVRERALFKEGNIWYAVNGSMEALTLIYATILSILAFVYALAVFKGAYFKKAFSLPSGKKPKKRILNIKGRAEKKTVHGGRYDDAWKRRIIFLLFVVMSIYVERNSRIYLDVSFVYQGLLSQVLYVANFAALLGYAVVTQAQFENGDGRLLIKAVGNAGGSEIHLVGKLAVIETAKRLKAFVPLIVPAAVFVLYKTKLVMWKTDVGGYYHLIRGSMLYPEERMEIAVVLAASLLFLIIAANELIKCVDRILGPPKKARRFGKVSPIVKASQWAGGRIGMKAGKSEASKNKKTSDFKVVDFLRSFRQWPLWKWFFVTPAEGFTVISIIGSLLLLIGAGQLIGLLFRDELYPGYACALAAVYLAGGASLRMFVWMNYTWKIGETFGADSGGADEGRRGKKERAKASDKKVLMALALILLATPIVWALTGFNFLGHLWLCDPKNWISQGANPKIFANPSATLAAGSLLVGLGTMAVAAVIAAFWMILLKGAESYKIGHSDGSWFGKASSLIVAALKAIPFVVVALLLRLTYDFEGNELSIWRWGGKTTAGEAQALLAHIVAAPGLFYSILALGLTGGAVILEWLRGKKDEYLESSTRRANFNLFLPFRSIVRNEIFLKNHRELQILFLFIAAAAILMEMISGCILDAFNIARPLYASMGSILYLSPAAGSPDTMQALVMKVVFVAGMLFLGSMIVAYGMPRKRRKYRFEDSTVYVDDKPIVTDIPRKFYADKYIQLPGLQMLLGPSGSGKTTVGRALESIYPDRALLVPQDPDEALNPAISLADFLSVIGDGNEQRTALSDLGILQDTDLAERLEDPYVSIFNLSRGERQRLMFVLCLTAVKRRHFLLFDEFTASQDESRKHSMLNLLEKIVRPKDGEPWKGMDETCLAIISHDATVIDRLLTWKNRHDELMPRILWLGKADENGESPETALRKGRDFKVGAGIQRDESGVYELEYPAGDREIQEFFSEIREMQKSTEGVERFEGVEVRESFNSTQPIHKLKFKSGKLSMGEKHLDVVGAPAVKPKNIYFLTGPSGIGKTRFFEAILDNAASHGGVELAYVPQDCGRTIPEEICAREYLEPLIATRGSIDKTVNDLREFFGKDNAAFTADKLTQEIKTFSEGERHRLFLANAILRMRDRRRRTGSVALHLLLLDEVFGNTDPGTHRFLMEKVANLVSQPREKWAVVLVSHTLEYDMRVTQDFLARDSQSQSQVGISIWKIERK